MIIKVKYPCFQYEIENPLNVRYGPEIEGEWVVDEKDSKWKLVCVRTHVNGLPIPKENEILYKYKHKRGYLLNK